MNPTTKKLLLDACIYFGKIQIWEADNFLKKKIIVSLEKDYIYPLVFH